MSNIDQTLQNVIAQLQSLAAGSAGAEKTKLNQHIGDLKAKSLAITSAVNGREARVNGDRQRIAQSNSIAIGHLLKYGPGLSSQNDRQKAAAHAASLAGFDETRIGDLAEFIAKGIESELIAAALLLLEGLGRLDQLNAEQRAKLDSIRLEARELSLNAVVDAEELKVFRDAGKLFSEVQVFLNLEVAIDSSLSGKPSEAQQVASFANSWLNTVLTPLTRALMDTQNSDYDAIRESLQSINLQLKDKLEELQGIVKTIKSLNAYLSFVSGIIGFVLAV